MNQKTKKIIKVVLGLIILAIVVIAGFMYFGLRGIPESHTQGNVPAQVVFEEYLSRDLDSYFGKKEGVTVETQYELLRNEPTQSGLAYPKYYAWVKIKSLTNSSVIDRGAVRIAAIDKEGFQVTDYVSEKEIKANPDVLTSLFPDDVVQKIKSKL